jgi:RNA polymerase sigma-70 factor (ECF subfamily)
MEESELGRKIDQAIHRLPEKCRIVFLMSRAEEMSYAEIAANLGISIKTVENQIGKALKLLRHEISGHRG